MNSAIHTDCFCLQHFDPIDFKAWIEAYRKSFAVEIKSLILLKNKIVYAPSLHIKFYDLQMPTVQILLRKFKKIKHV
jgi:hypothetical protein